MRRVESLAGIQSALADLGERTCMTIGNFDGVHLGHRDLLGEVVERARTLGAVPAALTFEPHPVRFFRGPDYPAFRLTPAAQKAERIAAAGIELLAVVRFDAELAAMTPETFVDRIVVDAFAARFVLVGYDFSFGKGRTGTIQNLVDLGRANGFETASFGPVLDGDQPVSSSRIRAAVRAGELREAGRLMLAPFTLAGEVVGGDARGREIGYPTANMSVDGGQLQPPHGIYVSTLASPTHGAMPAVTSIGVRPTYYEAETAPVTVETFVLSAPDALDLYGQSVELALHEYIRPELAFDSTEALVEQIAHDVARAEAWHATQGT